MNPVLASEPLLFVDLETTGANLANDRIIEIGFIEVDQNGAREWSSLVNPNTPISDFITGLTGINSAMVSSAPGFDTERRFAIPVAHIESRSAVHTAG